MKKANKLSKTATNYELEHGTLKDISDYLSAMEETYTEYASHADKIQELNIQSASYRSFDGINNYAIVSYGYLKMFPNMINRELEFWRI